MFLSLLLIFCSCTSKTIEIAQIKTEKGEILIKLHEQKPKHKKSFIQLAKQGYWDSSSFNRVIPDFVAQAGCPDTTEGFKDPKYLLNPEFDKSLTHIYGAVGAGRDANPKKQSARCQFYIVQNKKGLHRLDNDYTVFGQVIKVMNIVDQIVSVKRNESNTPLNRINLDINIIQISKKYLDKLLN